MSDEIYYDEDRNEIPMPLEDWKKHLAEKESLTNVVDCNGNKIEAGDSLTAIKDLDVKGGDTIKRGDKFTNVTLTDDPTHVRAKHKKHGTIFLKTEFFKKG